MSNDLVKRLRWRGKTMAKPKHDDGVFIRRLKEPLSEIEITDPDDAFWDRIVHEREAAAEAILQYRKMLTDHVREICIYRYIFRAIGTEDADAVSSDLPYETMSPLDCYEAGLIDGAMAVRNAVKKTAQKALNREFDEWDPPALEGKG